MARFNSESMAQAKATISLYPQKRSALIPLCHLAQAQDGWLTPEAMEHIGELVGVTAAEVYGTASFYDMLHTEQIGRYLIGVCTNIACLLDGAYELLEHAEQRLGIRVGQTTGDGEFTLEEMECLAHCDQAPCLQVNYRFFSRVTGADFDSLVDDLTESKRGDEVPLHGVLNRVAREGGLRCSAEEISQRRHPGAAKAANSGHQGGS
ncbi:MAG: NADH-quinone oxidoreductase subunit NuoE [Acidimicrobiales bacterium]